MSKLTPIQKKILTFIEEEVAERGAPPTLRNIAKAFGFKAIGTVQDHLRALMQKGFLEKDKGRARGIRLSDRYRSGAVSISILGAVSAGHPREADELILGSTSVPSHVARKGDCFALRVSGDSMVNAGIHDGDLVVARQQQTAGHGDIVVVLVEGETTVKRLEKRGRSFFLVPENPRYRPMELKTSDAFIQGKVVAVQRFYE